MAVAFLLCLGAGVFAPQAAMAQTVSVRVGGNSYISGDKGESDSASYSLQVTGAPVENSECMVHGTGTPGPWSGPSYKWSAPTVDDSSGIKASLSSDMSATATATTQQVTLYVQVLRPGDYTISLTGSVEFKSSCGNVSDDDTKIISVHVEGKKWDVGQEIDLGDVVLPSPNKDPLVPTYIEQGASVAFEVGEATDSDHWKFKDEEGTDPDTITYKWSDDSGGFVGGVTKLENGDRRAIWTALALPPKVDSITLTLTCEVDDTPKDIPDDEGGTRGDEAVEQKFTITIVKKVWKADTAIGKSRDSNNNVVENGRLKSPVDRRNHDAQTVKVGPGGRLGFEVEEATDTDTWEKKSPEGTVIATGTAPDKIKSYTWKCDDGKFVKLDEEGKPELDEDGKEQLVDTVTGLKATWVAWSSPKKVKVWCEIEDEGPSVPQDEGGTRDDDALKSEQEVEIVSVDLVVRRKGSEQDWATETHIAAGGKESDEQKADVLVKFQNGEKDLPMGKVEVVDEEAKGHEGVDAKFTMSSSTEGVFTSSNFIGKRIKVQLSAGPGTTEATVVQVWDDDPSWGYGPSFEYGKASSVTFSPRFKDDDEPIVIKAQTVGFEVTKITVLLWNADEGDFSPYSFSPGSPKWDIVKKLVKFDPATAASSSGVYSTGLVVTYDPKRIVDEVEFDATGLDVWN